MGKTKAFKSHDAGAQYLCGHSAKDPQTAQCAKKKGLDTYTFQGGWKIEIVRAAGIGGYACSQKDPTNVFRSGWTAASPCHCPGERLRQLRQWPSRNTPNGAPCRLEHIATVDARHTSVTRLVRS